MASTPRSGRRCTRAATDPLGRGRYVARHDLGEANPNRCLLRRPRHASSPYGLLSISYPDPNTGLAMMNWIAEVTMDNTEGWKQRGWFRQVSVDDFVHHFANWTWDWLEYPPCSDRPTAPSKPHDRPRPCAQLAGWSRGAARRCGARHVSDRLQRRQPSHCRCRVLGAAMVQHGVTPLALAAYDAKLCGPISQLVLRNRAPAHSDCSTSSMNAAAAASTISTM